MENQFNLPEDLSSLTGEELQGLIESGQAEFGTLYDSEDISNETLERMEFIANSIEGVVNEQNSRRRAELSAQVTPEVTEVDVEELAADVEDDSEPEAEEAEEPAEELAAEVEIEEVAVEAADEVEELAAETEAVEEAEAEEEVVVTAASTTPKESAVKTNPQIAVPERPSVVIAAAVDVPSFYVGQKLDPTSLADALHHKARMLSDSRGNQTVYPVATIERPFAPEYDLEGLDQAATWDAIQAGAAPSALTAAGGWCAPSEIVYDLFEVECTSESLFTLPTFRVTRGGVRWPVFAPHDEAFNPGFVWTEANDIAATGGTPTKPCVRIPCPTFTECRLDATGLCITAGNLIDRAYPEQVRWFLNRAMRAYERNNAIRKLNLVLADTAPAVLAASFGAASATVAGLLLQAADYRQLHGLCANETLDVTAPSWLTEIFKADVARQEGVFTGEGSLPTDAAVGAWFAAANLNLKYIDNWQEFTHPALTWPTSVQVLISYPGSYVEFNGGRLDIGVIRDSVLNATNDYTAVWFEEFYCVGRRGPQGRLVTIPLCPNGEVGARVAATGDGGCPIA